MDFQGLAEQPTTRAWYGMELNEKWNGMERKFRYGKWKMPEWNGRHSSILTYQFQYKCYKYNYNLKISVIKNSI